MWKQFSTQDEKLFFLKYKTNKYLENMYVWERVKERIIVYMHVGKQLFLFVR